MQPRRFDDNLLRKTTVGYQRDYAVTWHPFLDSVAHRLHDACYFATRRKWTRGLQLITVFDNQNVRIIDCTGQHAHTNLARSRLGRFDLSQYEGVWAARSY